MGVGGSLLPLCTVEYFWDGLDALLVGLGGGCDCCLCDCGTEKAVSILGLNCKAFTPAWLGGRPPPSEPPKSAGF